MAFQNRSLSFIKFPLQKIFLSIICCIIFFNHIIEYIWILGLENSKNVKFLFLFLFSAFVKTNGTVNFNK